MSNILDNCSTSEHIDTLPQSNDKKKKIEKVYQNLYECYSKLYTQGPYHSRQAYYLKTDTTRAIEHFESVVTETDNSFKNLVFNVCLFDCSSIQESYQMDHFENDIEYCVKKLIQPLFTIEHFSNSFSIILPEHFIKESKSGALMANILESKLLFKKIRNMGMHLDMNTYNDTFADDMKSKEHSFVIRKVEDESMLLDFAEVNKAGYYGRLSKKESDLFKSLNPYDDSVVRWLGYLLSTSSSDNTNKVGNNGETIIASGAIFYNKYNNSGHVMDITVHKKYRRQGFGSLMTKQTLNDAKKKGIAFCTLGSTWSAMTIYEKIGFKQVEEICYFRYSMPKPHHEKRSSQDGRDQYHVSKIRKMHENSDIGYQGQYHSNCRY